MSDTSTFQALTRSRSTVTLPKFTPAPAKTRARTNRRGLIAGVVAATALAGASALGFTLTQHSPTPDETHSASASEKRHIQVVKPTHSIAGELKLPATLQPYQSTDIYARTSGYLKSWRVDIGDQVTQGQLLAELDTPELDQELLQAEAQSAQAQAAIAEAVAEHAESKEQLELGKAQIDRADAQYALAQTTHARNTPLAARQAISVQELDESAATLAARKAEVAAAKAQLAGLTANVSTREAVIKSREAALESARANVERLKRLQSFQKLTAPFAGVITRRSAEVGMLVTAGATSQTPLFSLAENDRLRVQVAVPQSQSSRIAVNQEARLQSPEHAGKEFTGTVARTAAFVEPRSRTLNVEIELDNAEHALLPGGYAEVHLAMRDTTQRIRIPTSTLLMKSTGVFVAMVNRDSAIELVPIKLGRDFGAEVEDADGLQGAESLVINPPDDLVSGEFVTFAAKAATEVAEE